ncbi:MAG: acetyl-CoA carboxylase biotin carboxyl carrier protein [Candidatus Brocadiaceae bacterium]|nr:acetyl-CoA carboxylase biotin carboxyl carrier protein [Candidatus Brocadiaceae bacterium]
MDAVERVRQLIEIMSSNDLAELEVDEPDLRIKLRRNVPIQYSPPPGLAYAALPPQGSVPPQTALQVPGLGGEPGGPVHDNTLLEITSPMVGTFYRSSSPGAEPYVSIGTEVDPETVVCIIEAMKVMNEMKAEVPGTVVEILVEDGEPVEFGQVLFLLEPIAE